MIITEVTIGGKIYKKITPATGKLIRRKIDGHLYNAPLILGYVYRYGVKQLTEPHLEVPSDFEDYVQSSGDYVTSTEFNQWLSANTTNKIDSIEELKTFLGNTLDTDTLAGLIAAGGGGGTSNGGKYVIVSDLGEVGEPEDGMIAYIPAQTLDECYVGIKMNTTATQSGVDFGFEIKNGNGDSKWRPPCYPNPHDGVHLAGPNATEGFYFQDYVHLGFEGDATDDDAEMYMIVTLSNKAFEDGWTIDTWGDDVEVEYDYDETLEVTTNNHRYFYVGEDWLLYDESIYVNKCSTEDIQALRTYILDKTATDAAIVPQISYSFNPSGGEEDSTVNFSLRRNAVFKGFAVTYENICNLATLTLFEDGTYSVAYTPLELKNSQTKFIVNEDLSFKKYAGDHPGQALYLYNQTDSNWVGPNFALCVENSEGQRKQTGFVCGWNDTNSESKMYVQFVMIDGSKTKIVKYVSTDSGTNWTLDQTQKLYKEEVLTETEYNAITTKDDNTIYFIK